MSVEFPFTLGNGAFARAWEYATGKFLPYSMVVTGTPTIVAGNQSISVTTGSSLTVPSGATHALITVDAGAGDIRYWEDGTTPASGAVGLLIPAGQAAELTNLGNVRLRASTGTVLVNVSYRRYDL